MIHHPYPFKFYTSLVILDEPFHLYSVIPRSLLLPPTNPSLLILPPEQARIEGCRHHAHTANTQTDGIAIPIQRRIGRHERKRGDESAAVAEPDRPRHTNAALGMAGEVHNVPADDNGSDGESAHGGEADCGILRCKGVVHFGEDGQAGDKNSLAEGDKGVAETGGMREVGEEEAEAECCSDWGDRV